MSAISLKSISGITSITTPAGVDDQLTLHNNNTTEAVKLDIAGNLHFHNHLNITGVSTASNFKTGTSNLHNTGLNVQDLDVDGHTELDNVNIVGVTTHNGQAKFYGNGGASLIWGDTGYSGHLSFDGSNNAVIRAASGKALIFQTDHVNTRMTIGSQGNVSIEKDLDVDGHTNLDNVSIVGITTTTSNIEIKGNNKYLKLGASDQFAFVTAGSQSFITDSTGRITQRSASYTWENYAGNTEYLRIASNGRVGINTDNPQTYLYSMNEIAAGDGNRQFIGMEAKTVNGTPVGEIRTTFYSGASGAYPEMRFVTHDTERLRINSNGTVHTGMTGTAPTWLGSTIATREKFSIFQGANFGEACFNIDVDNANSFLSHNMYYSSGWKIKKSGSPVRHLEIGTNGWTFMTGADASNDSVSSLTNKFRIKPSGRVQILNNNEDIDMSSSSDGQLTIDGNGYTGAIALNDEGMFLYHNSSTRYIGIGVNETEVGRFTTAGYEQRFSNTSTYSSTTGSRKGIYVFNSGATTNCYASLELAANNSSGYFGSTILNSIATADTSYSNHFAIQLRHGGNYYERLRIASDGQVGINATNPQSMFEVAESSTGQSETQKRIAIFRKNGTAVGDEGYIHLTTMTGHYGVKLGFANEGASPTYLNQGFFISTVHGNENITNHQKRFVIKSNGNIGINQTDPSRARLHVVGPSSSGTEIVAKFKGASGADARTKIGLAAAYSDTANDTEGQAYVGAYRNGSGNTSQLFFEVSTGSTLKELARVDNNGINVGGSYRFNNGARDSATMPNTHNIGDVSSNTISYQHNAGFYYVYATIPTDGNWYDMFTSINDSACNFRGVCGDASSKNSFYWYFNPTSPGYGVNPYGEKWHHGSWNTGSVTFRLDGSHPNWNLQIKCTSYYGTNRTASLRAIMEVYY